MKTVVLIPSYEPTVVFVQFIQRLVQSFTHIVVVDDGSGSEYRTIFDQIENMGVPVLRHAINQGKGRSLKTGFNYIINTHGSDSGIITADSDGQHSIEDIKKISEVLVQHPSDLILGSRDFDQDNVPFKSMFGNKLSRVVLSFFCGVTVSDTQTGLRGLSALTAGSFISVSGERFDYETNMLIESKKLHIHITEEKIKTIYLDENKGTHFNPIRDSLQIYTLFAKYMFVSLSSFLVDIVLFALFLSMLSTGNVNRILIGTIAARIFSSLFNYFMNCKTVFKGVNNFTTLIKYYMLVVIQMFVSGLSVQLIDEVCPPFLNVVFIKLVVDTILFAINFYIQREWIFRTEEENRV